jgi:hypothetical protein
LRAPPILGRFKLLRPEANISAQCSADMPVPLVVMFQ